MNELFNVPDLKNEDAGELLNELAKDLDAFNRLKFADFNAPDYDAVYGTGYIRKEIESRFKGNPPIKFLEDLLSYYNKKKRDLEVNTIPTVLKSMGLTNVTTKSGIEISLKQEVSFPALSKLPDVLKQKLFDWLEKNNAGDLIKDNVVLGKGEFNQQLEDFLEGNGYSYSRNSDINFQTLKSFLSKIIEGRRKGEQLELPPESVLKVEAFDIAKIKNKGETNG